jgi:hypothetical protein
MSGLEQSILVMSFAIGFALPLTVSQFCRGREVWVAVPEPCKTAE